MRVVGEGQRLAGRGNRVQGGDGGEHLLVAQSVVVIVEAKHCWLVEEAGAVDLMATCEDLCP